MATDIKERWRSYVSPDTRLQIYKKSFQLQTLKKVRFMKTASEMV
jgi:hypothetical protein